MANKGGRGGEVGSRSERRQSGSSQELVGEPHMMRYGNGNGELKVSGVIRVWGVAVG